MCDLDLGRRFHGERGLGVHEQIAGFVFKGSFLFCSRTLSHGSGEKKEGAFHVMSEACLLFRYECGTDHRPAWESLVELVASGSVKGWERVVYSEYSSLPRSEETSVMSFPLAN